MATSSTDDFAFALRSGRRVATTRQRRTVLAAVLGPAAGLVMGAFLWQASFADRSVELESPGSGWTGGVVAVSSTDAGSALFTAVSAAPGTTEQRCVAVRYDGDVAARVRLAVTGLSGALPANLAWTVEEGSGGGAPGGSCAGFTPSASPAWTGTLAAFAADHVDYDTGWGDFTPSTAGEVRVYRVSYAVADTDAAQAASAGFTLRWEARTT